MQNVLWIEDSARFELTSLTGPVYFCGKFDFHLAEDVTAALDLIQDKSFDAIIVDIRLPPGADRHWNLLYEKASAGKVQDQLGFKLLNWFLGREAPNGRTPPGWVRPGLLAVFTVEGDPDLQKQVLELGVIYRQKTAGSSDTVLLELIEEILRS